MAEYTYDYGKRTIIKDGVVYLSTDLYGRINLPITLVKPELRYKKGTVELQGDKVIIKYSKNNPDNLNKRRVTIPTAIRCVLKLQRDDYFKVARNKDGTIFTLTIATDELTDEDLGKDKNE